MSAIYCKRQGLKVNFAPGIDGEKGGVPLVHDLHSVEIWGEIAELSPLNYLKSLQNFNS